MNRTRQLTLALLALLGLACTGCWTIAASVAGGALLATGVRSMEDSVEESVAMPLEEAAAAAHTALDELDVQVVRQSAHRAAKTITRYDLEACMVGDEMTPVDVTVEKLSAKVTRIRVTARQSWSRPEPYIARKILDRIASVVRASTRRGKARPGVLAVP